MQVKDFLGVFQNDYTAIWIQGYETGTDYTHGFKDEILSNPECNIVLNSEVKSIYIDAIGDILITIHG